MATPRVRRRDHSLLSSARHLGWIARTGIVLNIKKISLNLCYYLALSGMFWRGLFAAISIEIINNTRGGIQSKIWERANGLCELEC